MSCNQVRRLPVTEAGKIIGIKGAVEQSAKVKTSVIII